MKVSSCCYARVIDETDVCSLCYEHCDVIDEDEAIEENELSWLDDNHEFKIVTVNGKEIRCKS